MKIAAAAYLLSGLALLGILWLHLLPALFAGLLIYELVHVIAARSAYLRVGHERKKILAVSLIASVVAVALVAACIGLWAFLRSDAGSATALLDKLADVIDGARAALPGWLVETLPADAEALRAACVAWLKTHAAELEHAGLETGRGLVHVLIGLVVGAMVSLAEVRVAEDRGPLARALCERAVRLGDAFRRIVFAQVRIAALNTVLTALFLLAVLPFFGVHLPLVKTMIAVTFIVGLLPVIGNLISNSFIVIVGLSQSATAALGCLAFLVVIHKLEYFVNARLVGTQIHARAWELLLAMLVMEAAFGIAGVVAAPIYYAYLKDELKARGAI